MQKALQQGTIMVVDDTPANLKLLQEMLQAEGYRVLAFPRGALALKAAAANPPDLILLDICMPEMDGFEVCQRLKADAAMREIPVLFLSALSEIDHKIRAFSVGGVDYVTKPFQFEEVRARVQTHLEHHRQKRKLQQSYDELRELGQRVRDRTAELEAANQELEAFSYSVSHDLRSPLNSISGFANILRDSHAASLDAQGQRFLDTIVGESARMSQLIDDLLDFSRLGRQSLLRCSIDMEALAHTVFKELAGREPERTLQLSLEPLPPARGDPSLVRQVWVNLLANAIKYTRPRQVAQIKIDSRKENGEITYLVQDNGVGFDMKHAGRLFGVFQRLHSKSQFEGTGVGLALTDRIIRRHGGRVWADAKVDAGATFFFTLPDDGNV